jgi:hypothetical protein
MNRGRARVGGFAAALAFGVLAACAPRSDTDTGESIRRDSSGVEIVENRGSPATVAEWRVVEPAEVSIGGAEATGPTSFERVTGALRLRDGGIVVTDGRAGEVRLFDAGGRILKVLSRRGAGPGEFQFPGSPTPHLADSFVIMDLSAGRAALFDPGGALARSIALPPFDPARQLVARGLLSGDEFWGSQVILDFPKTAGVRLRRAEPYVRFRSGSSRVDTIAIGRGIDWVSVPGREGGHSFVSLDNVGMGASTQVQSQGDRFFLGDTDVPEIRMHALDGRLLRIVRWTAEPDPVTSDDRKASFGFDSSQLAGAGGGDEGMRQQMFANMRTKQFAVVAPYFTALLVGGEGELWVEQFARPWRLVRRYLVVDSTGVLAARVAMPAGFRPYQVGTDFVLGRWRDEDDVDHIRLHRLDRCAGR